MGSQNSRGIYLSDAHILNPANFNIIIQYKVPKLIWKEHMREVCCLDWNQTRQQQLVLSSSWDRTIKMVQRKTQIFRGNLLSRLYEPKVGP